MHVNPELSRALPNRMSKFIPGMVLLAVIALTTVYLVVDDSAGPTELVQSVDASKYKRVIVSLEPSCKNGECAQSDLQKIDKRTRAHSKIIDSISRKVNSVKRVIKLLSKRVFGPGIPDKKTAKKKQRRTAGVLRRLARVSKRAPGKGLKGRLRKTWRRLRRALRGKGALFRRRCGSRHKATPCGRALRNLKSLIRRRLKRRRSGRKKLRARRIRQYKAQLRRARRMFRRRLRRSVRSARRRFRRSRRRRRRRRGGRRRRRRRGRRGRRRRRRRRRKTRRRKRRRRRRRKFSRKVFGRRGRKYRRISRRRRRRRRRHW
mmetsp:Transcript_55821/g.131774  ORF Transcript_55821/g.131774 Transcript_55821/m.131774 type:complete len:318 (+) Transcript_55821:75-1028(+)